MNIFAKATKEKLRFSTTVGSLTVEELWELPIESKNKLCLRTLATNLQKQLDLTSTSELDFLDSTDVDPTVQLKFDIVKYIVISKLEEAKAKTEEKVKESHRSEILELIKIKKQEEMKDKSIAELEAML